MRCNSDSKARVTLYVSDRFTGMIVYSNFGVKQDTGIFSSEELLMNCMESNRFNHVALVSPTAYTQHNNTITFHRNVLIRTQFDIF